MNIKGFKRLIIIFSIVSLLLTQSVFGQSQVSTSIEDTTIEDTSSENVDLDYLKSIIDMLKEKYNGHISDRELIEGAVKGMFDSLDKYTTFFSLKEANQFLGDINGKYQGIGISIVQDGDYILVTKVFSASPAEKAGIIKGDKIATVDGKSIAGFSSEEAAGLIKGKENTKVNLGIVRTDENNIINIEVERGQIKVNPVEYKIMDDIGYVKIDTFNANTAEYFKKAMKDLDKNNVAKIILDLRNNPGGEVTQSVAVAKYFVPEGLITKLDFKSENVEDIEYYSKLKESKYKLAVLINGMSASASEILAGAIQDTKSGVLIGTKSYGKAKVQNMVPILTPEAYKKYEEQLGKKVVDGYELMKVYNIYPSDDEIIGWSKITTGEYTTPNGRMIDKEGLTPDIAVEDYPLIEKIDINNIQELLKVSKPILDSEGFDVYNAEKILLLSGYDVDTPDLKLDKKTFAAIMKFQEDSGLFPYGVLDYTTQDALNAKLDNLLRVIDEQYAKALEVLTQDGQSEKE